MATHLGTQSTEGGAADKELNLRNRLDQSKSPYVRGHMNNPVAWQLWDSEAIDLAKKFNRLIFVSIGYSACHWCHVMEKESFMSPEVAATLNESFIPIKLDREERPDIDDVYMNYVQATTGSGGWPLNVFLTPDLEPVFGGTYWPGPNSSSLPRLGVEGPVGFVDILEKLRDVWNTQQQRCLQSAKEITRQLREFAEEGTHSHQDEPAEVKEDLEVELLEEAYRHFSNRFDSVNGGFSRAPKFPTPVNLSFLLRLGKYPPTVVDVIGHDECAQATAMVTQTLVKMSRGGIRDHIGYGFCRYSVTSDWSLPHFEKMLYDQAQLLDVYVDAFVASQEPELLGAIYDIVTYLTSPPVLSPLGGLCSSEDADSKPSPNDNEKREGAFYIWTLKELQQILGQRDAGVCARHWGVMADGNVARQNDPHDEFMNQNVLSIQSTPSKLAKEFGLSEDEVVKIIKSSRQKLRDYREEKRVRPDLDDKIIVGWNGLAIAALAKCGTALKSVDSAKSTECITTAQNIVKFVKNNLFDSSTGQLWRIYRGVSRGDTPGFAEDYAYLTSGLINMYEATFDDSHLQFADQLQKYLNANFMARSSNSDAAAGYYMTSSTPSTDTPGPLLRLKPGTDSATPSANGIIAQNLLRLSALLEEDSYKTLAEQTCNAFSVEILQHPFLFVGLLDAIVALEIGVKSVVGVLGSASTLTPSTIFGDTLTPASEEELCIHIAKEKLKGEAGPATSTSTAVLSLVDFVSKGGEEKTKWLREKNETLKDLKGGKNFLLVCEGKSCKTVDM